MDKLLVWLECTSCSFHCHLVVWFTPSLLWWFRCVDAKHFLMRILKGRGITNVHINWRYIRVWENVGTEVQKLHCPLFSRPFSPLGWGGCRACALQIVFYFRATLTHSHSNIQTITEFLISPLCLHIFGLWEEAEVAGESPHEYGLLAMRC